MTLSIIKRRSISPKNGFREWFRKLYSGRKTNRPTLDPVHTGEVHNNSRPWPEIHRPSSHHAETERSTGVTLPHSKPEPHQPNGLLVHETPPTFPQEEKPPEPPPFPPTNKNLAPVSLSVDLKRGSPSPVELKASILPIWVRCKLFVILNGERLRHHEEASCNWNDASYFDYLQNAADRIIAEQGHFHQEDGSARLYKRAGRCRLVRDEDDFGVESIIIENKRQWEQYLPLMVAKFATSNHFIPFYLDFCWEYSLLIIKRQSGVPYAVTVREVLYSRRQHNYRGQRYFPRQVVDNLFKTSTVKELIDQDESLKKFAQRLLSESGLVWDKEKFIAHVVADGIVYLALCIYAKLPLECLYNLMDKHKDCTATLKVSDCPNGTSRSDFDDLVGLQGSFRAHTFYNDGGHPEHQKLDNNVVVPIMFDEKSDLIGSGSFGEVFRVHIDAEHHQFSPDRDTVYALKRFHVNKSTEENFGKEANALRALAKVPHPNITLHLTSWTQDGRFYMLFPCAESNLQHHLLTEPAPELNKEFVLFLLTQLRDLADAVEHIHNLNLGDSIQKPENVAHNHRGKLRVGTEPKYRHRGFHYDLKPDNILIFQRDKKADPVWRIGDFGTAQINEIVLSGSQQPTGTERVEGAARGDPEYGAPDYAYQDWSSRPYDIWSLGCIYSLVLLWTFSYSGQDLRDFQVERLKTSEPQSNQSPAFWYRDRQKKIKLKPAVVAKLKELRSCCHDRGVFRDLVTLTANMLTIIPEERPVASKVRSDINALLIQAKNDLENPNFYKDGLSDREIIAKPVTVLQSRSRSGSIDLRSVAALPATPDLADRSRPRLQVYRRSSSEPLPKVEPLDTADGGGVEFAGDHLENGTNFLHRSRSPSISIVDTDGTVRLHLDSELGSPSPILAYKNIVRNQDI